MKTLITLAANQGANWSLIWSDISLFVCLLLLGLAVYFWRKQQKQRENYLVKSTSKICKLEGEKMDLLEKFRLYKNDVTAELITRQSRINELEEKAQKRNADGTFAVKSGKGHGKKRKDWTKASKEELLTEAKKRYPVGTKFICLWSNDEEIVTNANYWDDSDEMEAIWFKVKFSANGMVYNNGKWAKIIKP